MSPNKILPVFQFTAGVIIAALLCPLVNFVALFIFASLIFTTSFFLKSYRKFAIVAFSGFLAVAVSALISYTPPLEKEAFGHTQQFEGIVEESSSNSTSTRCIVKLNEPKIRCRVTLPSDIDIPANGDSVKFTAMLMPAGHPMNFPFVGIGKLKAYALHIDAQAYPTNNSWEITYETPKISLAQRCRWSIEDALYRSPLNPQTRDLIISATLGSDLNDIETADAFRQAGISHIFCVSGFHVAFVASIFGLFLQVLILWRRLRIWRYILLLPPIWGYVYITGMNPPAIRAGVMISCVIMSQVFEREITGLQSLALATSIILICTPWVVYSTGFQLSVFAVLGLILLLRPIILMAGKNVILGKILSIFFAPIAATLFTFPILLQNFHYFPLLFIPANIVASLLFPVLMFTGGVSAIGSAIGLHFGGISWVANLSASIIIRVAEACASVTNGIVRDIYPSSIITILLIIAVIGIAVIILSSRIRIKTISFCITCVAMFFAIIIPTDKNNEIIVGANSNGVTAILRSNQKGIISTLGHKGNPAIDVSRYFAAYGIEHPDTIRGNGVLLDDYLLMRIGPTTKVSSLPPIPPESTLILIVEGRPRHFEEILQNSKIPSAVLIAPDATLPADIFTSANIPVINLANQSWKINF